MVNMFMIFRNGYDRAKMIDDKTIKEVLADYYPAHFSAWQSPASMSNARLSKKTVSIG